MVIPLPGSLVMTTVPPTSSTFRLTTSMPTPRPEYSVTSVLVEKPGGHQKVENIPVGIFHVRQSDAVSDGLVEHGVIVDALAVIPDLNDDLAPGVPVRIG